MVVVLSSFIGRTSAGILGSGPHSLRGGEQQEGHGLSWVETVHGEAVNDLAVDYAVDVAQTALLVAAEGAPAPALAHLRSGTGRGREVDSDLARLGPRARGGYVRCWGLAQPVEQRIGGWVPDQSGQVLGFGEPDGHGVVQEGEERVEKAGHIK